MLYDLKWFKWLVKREIKYKFTYWLDFCKQFYGFIDSYEI